MKSIGVVRKVDQLGRIAIPKELRKVLKIEIGIPIEFYTQDDMIVLKKYSPQKACMITGEVLNENIEYAPGLFLSRKGAEILAKKIENENNI